MVKSWINVNSNIDVLWWIELKLKWQITVSNLFLKFNQYKDANIANLVY